MSSSSRLMLSVLVAVGLWSGGIGTSSTLGQEPPCCKEATSDAGNGSASIEQAWLESVARLHTLAAEGRLGASADASVLPAGAFSEIPSGSPKARRKARRKLDTQLLERIADLEQRVAVLEANGGGCGAVECSDSSAPCCSEASSPEACSTEPCGSDPAPDALVALAAIDSGDRNLVADCKPMGSRTESIGSLSMAASSVAMGATTSADLESAQTQLVAMEQRIAALADAEQRILERIEQHLHDARLQRDRIVEEVLLQTDHLVELRESQGGKLDLDLVVSSARDTILGADLPRTLTGIQEFLVHIDEMLGDGVDQVLAQGADPQGSTHLGSGLIEAGQGLEGVSLADLLGQISAQVEGSQLPAEVAQSVQMLNQYGALNYVRMFKTNLKHVDVGEMLSQMAPQFHGINPGAHFHALADRMPGRLLPALLEGLANALEGLDAGALLEVLGAELRGVTPVPLLAGVEALLQGGTPSGALAAVGNQLKHVDLGRLLTRLGESVETVSMATTLETMSAELSGMTVAEALQEIEDGISAAGLGEIDLPVVLRQSGESLQRLDLPRRIQGLAGILDGLNSYLTETQGQLGLLTSEAEWSAFAALDAVAEVDPFEWVESDRSEVEVRAGIPLSEDLAEEVDVDIGEIPLDEDPAEEVKREAPIGPTGSTADQLEETRFLEQAVEDLRARGYGDEFPALKKALKKLGDARSRLGRSG